MSKSSHWNAIRNFLYYPLIAFIFLYFVSLTCAIFLMEISSWAIVLFFILYLIADRNCTKRTIELHFTGLEFPVIALIFTVGLGLKLNSPDIDFIDSFGRLRNFVPLFALIFSLKIFKRLNLLLWILLVCGSLVGIYAVWEHFSGIELWRARQLELIAPDSNRYSAMGLFGLDITFAHSYTMLAVIPWAALILSRRRSVVHTVTQLLLLAVLTSAVIVTYKRGAWIALFAALPIMTLYSGKKIFFKAMAVLLISLGALYISNPLIQSRVQSIFDSSMYSNEQRQNLWHANLEMFKEYPWLGIGYEQNEPRAHEYLAKLNIGDSMGGHAHNNYLGMLSSTGIIGFTFYMLFIVAALFMTLRLFSTIPHTHYWHRVIALSSFGAQLAFHIGGVTQWSFGDLEVQHLYFSWIAIAAYMSYQYFTHIVSDDYCL